MVANFDWGRELEWTAVAMVAYVAPERKWTDKFRQSADFDEFCEEMCEIPLGEGACFGTHNLYALAALVSADKLSSLLTGEARRRAIDRLRAAAQCLRTTQSANGSWDTRWSSPTSPDATSAVGPTVADVVVTSHSLEWLWICWDNAAIGGEPIDEACEFLA
jgi:hypothetical protein